MTTLFACDAPIRVVSKRAGGVPAAPGERVVDVDRTNKILGNPHLLQDHRDAQQRRRVIETYGRDLAADIAAGGPKSRAIDAIVARMKAGERIALRCWCAPKACHGDLIMTEAIERWRR